MAEKNADYQSTTDDDQACANDSGPFKDDDRTAEDPRASILITSDTQEATGNEDRERSTQMQYVHMREAVTDAGTADQGTADNFNVPVNNFISNSVTIIQGGGNTVNVFNSSKVTQVTQPALDDGMYGPISQTDNCPVNRESLHRHRKFLKGHMEYAYGLNDIILEEQILSDKERSTLKALGDDSYQINENILEFLYEKDNATYEKFLNALLESFQSHLRRLIIQDGEFDVNELDRPLTKSQISNMMRMERNILDNLQSQVGDIANELIAVRCINTDHYEEITLTTLRARVRTRTLMSIMRNRSLQHFLLFRQILRKINPVVYGFTDIEIPSLHSKEKLNILLERARQRREYSDRAPYLQCDWLYRHHSEEYFDDIKYNHSGVMPTYKKDNCGDPASPINGKLKGIFFSVNVDFSTGGPMDLSFYGDHRIILPCADYLKKSNLYFADFYCFEESENHYVTLVMSKPETEADIFCQENLVNLSKTDSAQNPFLFMKGDKAHVTTKIFVEVFYTESVDIRGITPEPIFTDKPGYSMSRRHLPKYQHCRICNL